MGFQNVNENIFHGFENLVIWLWKSLGNMFRVICAKTDKGWINSKFLLFNSVIIQYSVDGRWKAIL